MSAQWFEGINSNIGEYTFHWILNIKTFCNVTYNSNGSPGCIDFSLSSEWKVGTDEVENVIQKAISVKCIV